MQVTLYATLRDIGGGKHIDVPFQYGDTARDFVEAVRGCCPALADELVDADGNLTGSVHILVHGRNIQWLDGLDTVIEEGQDIDLIPPVAGG